MLTFVLAAALANTCLPDSGIEGICGPVASEDLARIPGTRWLIASGLNIGMPAHLYLVDSRSRQSSTLFPKSRPAFNMQADYRGICPGPLKPGSMSLDGLNVRAATRGAPSTLLAANHGDRHAIEIFRIDLNPEPALVWVGCVPMPAGTLANAVVALSDGGMLVSSFHDPDDKDAWSRMDRGEATGGVWEWHADRGWKLFAGGLSGANGIEVSADERTVFVSAWASSQVLVIDRATGTKKRTISLDFRPDNIHRAAGASLLVGGQRAAIRDIATCQASCPQPWLVARIDASSGSVVPLVSGPGSMAINYACGAVEVDGALFITLRGEPRIAWTRLGQRER